MEEVFGKASVGDEKEESKGAENNSSNAASFGPVPPKEDDFDQDEIKKAEDYKTQGNNFFKSKLIFLSRNFGMFLILLSYS